MFNVKSAIEEVMSVQRLKAESLGIEFYATYEHIKDSNLKLNKENSEPLIKKSSNDDDWFIFSDKSRLM